MKQYCLLVFICSASLGAMENGCSVDADTLEGIFISGLNRADGWLEKNQECIRELACWQPDDLRTKEARAAKRERIAHQLEQCSIPRLEDKINGEVVTINHVFQPDGKDFVVKVSNFGRMLAHLVLVAGEGDCTKETVDPNWDNVVQRVPHTYAHAGRYAVYLLARAAAREQRLSSVNLAPISLARIPGCSTSIEDGHAVVVQDYVPRFRALKRMDPDTQREFIDSNWDDEGRLKELYSLTKSAGIWDVCGNIGTTPEKPGSLHLCDFEPTIFNYPEDFLFQGERGCVRYYSDILDSQIRTHMFLSKGMGRAAEKWERIIANDVQFQAEIKKHIEVPSIVLEYKGNATSEHKKSIEAMYGELPSKYQ